MSAVHLLAATLAAHPLAGLTASALGAAAAIAFHGAVEFVVCRSLGGRPA